ncbi:MAG: tape measure protein [Dokdonella sp.]|nr:tape measure protein [Dokdonella sp.]
MAKFEETFRLYVEAEGEGDVKKMSKAFNELETELKDAGPEAQALLGELRKLTQLSAQVNGITKLKGEIYDTGDALALAKLRTAELEKEFKETAEPSRRLTRELERSRKAVTDLTAQQNRQNAELQRTQNAMRAAGLSTDKLGQAQQQVRQQIQEASDGLRQFAADATTTEKATSRVGGVLSGLRGVLAGLGIALSFRSAFDGVKNLLGLGDAAERARTQLAGLYGSAAAGNEAFKSIRTLARDNGREFDGLLDAAVKLKAFGLDPLDGTLQAIIDQSAKLGGSQETLTGITLGLGQAWAKQKLQGEEILQLVERGVPVWELLEKVTGKNVQELQKLSEAGKLGRREIKLLIDELGRASSGAAAANVNTLSGLVDQLRSRIRGFFEDVSDAGPLEFFKAQLRGLIDTVDRMARSGELAQWAKSTGEGVVSVATAIRDSITFVKDYGTAILTMVRAFVVFKAANVVATWAANSKALRAMAEAAAAPTTAIGKLRGVIGSIPRTLTFALVTAGVDWTVGKLEELVRVTQEYLDTRKLLKAAETELARVQAEAGRKAELIAQQYRDAADAQVAGADELARKSQIQSEAYRRQLEDAIRYYTALRIQQRAMGNGDEVESITARLKELVTALAAASQQMGEASRSIATLTGEFARKAAKDFEAARAAGKDTVAALDGIFAKVDLGTPQGIRDVVETFQVLGPRARDARKALETELIPALQKLTGEQLREFQRQAEAAFAAAKGGATDAAVIVEAVLGAALTRLGLSAAQAGVKFTAAGDDIIATFRVVAENAAATGEQITAAFRAALSKLTTREEVEALATELRRAAESGKLSFDALGRTLAAVDQRLAEIDAALDPLADKFSQFGIKTQRELNNAAAAARSFFDEVVSGAQRGEYAQADVVRAFAVMAEAQRQAVAQGTASEQARVESLLASKAAALGLSAELERAGVIGKQAGDDTANAMRGARDAIEDTTAAAGEMASQQTRVVEQVNATNNQIIIQTQLTDAQRRALLYLGQEWDAGRVSAEDYGRTLQDVMDGGTEAIERQIEAAERAREALQDITDQLRDEADRAAGNETDIERRRYQEQLDRIKELEEAGGAAARREAMEARRLAEEEHRRRLAEIREQAQARRDAERAEAPSGGGSSSGGGAEPGRRSSDLRAPVFNVTINGGQLDLTTDAGKRQLAGLLRNAMIHELREYRRRGGNL